MITTTAAYNAAEAQVPSKPVYILQINNYSKSFVYRPTGRANELAWIVDISDYSVDVDDINGSCTVSDITIKVIDLGASITNDLSLLTLEGRRCQLLAGFDGLDLADYVPIFSGVVLNVNSGGTDHTYDFVLTDFQRLNQRVIYLQGDVSTTTTRAVTFNSGTGVYTIVTTVDQKNLVNGAIVSNVSTATTTTSVTQSVGTTVTVDNAAISTTNPKRVTGHPLDILLDILLVQIGYSTDDVAIAQIEYYRDHVFNGVEFDFLLTSSCDAKDFIDNQLLKPLGGYECVDNNGVFYVGFAQPYAGFQTTGYQLTEKNIVTVPDFVQAPLLNVLTMRFDKDPVSGDYMAEANEIYAPTTDPSNITGEIADQDNGASNTIQGQQIIESDGMRSGFQGFLLASMVANSLFSKYGSNNPTCDVTTFWPAFRLMVVELVFLTHPLIPDRKAGVLGVSNMLFQIRKKSISFKDALVTLSLTDASNFIVIGAHRIAPTGEGPYTTVSSDHKAFYTFMTDATGKYSNGDAGGVLG